MEERTPDHASDPAFDPNPGFRATPPRTPLGIPNPDAPPSANRMGIAAFIASILGLSCLPFVGSIAGLVLGIVAVRRAPRGFAIAAIVLSAAGTCFIFPVLLGLLLPALAVARNAAREVRTEIAFVEVAARAREFRTDNGRLPADIVECYGSELPPFDGWGAPVRLRLFGDDLFVDSAGEDGVWDTGDDVTEHLVADGVFVDDGGEGVDRGLGDGFDDGLDEAMIDGTEDEPEDGTEEGATASGVTGEKAPPEREPGR